MKLKVNAPLVQLARQVQYLLIALLFASFAVTANAAEIGKEISRNRWEIATRFTQNAQCAGLPVEVFGKLKVDFEKVRRDGREVVVPKTVEVNGKKLLPQDASNRVHATGLGRTYNVDRVELEFTSVGSAFGSMVMRIFFVAKPNAVNTAKGDISPGNTFTFWAVYKPVEWSSNSDQKVTSFLSGKGEARCPKNP